MTTCTVVTWKREHGFAEASTGEVVYIHKTSMPEGTRLKAGEEVTCKLVKSDLYSRSRVMGENVTGKGVVSVDEVQTSAEKRAERKEWEKFKEEKIAGTGGPARIPSTRARRRQRHARGGKPVQSGRPEGVSATRRGTRSAAAMAARMARCGNKGLARHEYRQGAVDMADLPVISARGGELRVDPADGCPYPKESFEQVYGGYNEWDEARPPGMRGRGRGGGRGAGAGSRGGRGSMV